MTKFRKFNKEEKKEKEVVETVFTHTLDENGCKVEKKNILPPKTWGNVTLLDGKREYLDQFLVWDDRLGDNEYFVVLGKAGSEFDNL